MLVSDFDLAKKALKAHDRLAVMSLLGNVTKAQKAQIYLILNLMPAKEFKNLCNLALHGIAFLENKDMEGLEKYLTDIKIPGQIKQAILSRLITNDVIKNE